MALAVQIRAEFQHTTSKGHDNDKNPWYHRSPREGPVSTACDDDVEATLFRRAGSRIDDLASHSIALLHTRRSGDQVRERGKTTVVRRLFSGLQSEHVAGHDARQPAKSVS
jgi:hypothetical protein